MSTTAEGGVIAPPGEPRLMMPEAEAALLRAHYETARSILEYGAGGSTVLGARMPGKFIVSVESDHDFAVRLQWWLDQADLPSQAVIHHVDIGPTGKWGRPVNDRSWRKFHRYPMSVWSEPFFRHPDLVLVDGRFRPACFAACCLRIERPVTLLFDDYADRPKYHVVEQLAEPVQIVGRMAEFHLRPLARNGHALDLFLDFCTRPTFAAR